MGDGGALSGKIVGHYRVLEAIGSGGMAIVYLAEDLRHERKVAMKLLRPELAAGLGQDRFLREITTTANLRHPHILPLYDSGRADHPEGGAELLYYVMPYIEGESLRDRLTREKQLPLDEALAIAREVADALGYAHHRGVIHRDIKPENIMLESGHAVVADFGIARAVDAAGGAMLTGTGVAIGTVAYMSPEQAAGARDLDARSDLYGLACVTYEMLAGEPPFTGPTVESVIHQHLAVDPPSVTRLRATVPAAIDATLSRALAKAPADRFATASRFTDALGAATASAQKAFAPRSRPWRWIAGLGAAATVALLATLWRTPTPGPLTVPGPRIVVLPFGPVTPDSALDRKGRELAAALTANLDGMGELRTVDALTALAEVPPGRTLTLDQAHAVAARLGAGRLIHGALTEAGTTLRLDAALYETGSTDPLARSTVTGDGLPGIGDAVTIQLLDRLWQREAPLAASLAAVSRSTVPAARRAYLAGELALTRTEWNVAIEEFERAFTADTTFWWAYWRSLYPRSYRETEGADPELVRKVVEHRGELPEPDRLLIEATWMASGLNDELTRLRELTDRFPGYEPGWWAYGNRLVHFGGYVGHRTDEARYALERVLALNPRFTAAWDHLQWVALTEGDSATAVRAGRAATELLGGTVRLDESGRHVRAEFFGTRSISPERASALADTVLMAPTGMQELVAGGFLADGFPSVQIAFNRVMRGRSPPPGVGVRLLEGEALAWAARGAWDSTLVAADRWARAAGSSRDPGAYRLAVAGVLLGAIDPAAAARRRPDGAGGLEVHWLDGVLGYIEREPDRIAGARRALVDAPITSASDSTAQEALDRSLAALQRDAGGDRAGAAGAMMELELEMADRRLMSQIGPAHPLLNTANRLLAARWLRGLGRDTDAGHLLSWHEALPYAPAPLVAWNRAIGSITLLDRAEITEAAGQPERALKDYVRFLQWLDLPDPPLVPMVERARAARDRLLTPP